MSDSALYHEGNRELQDAFGSRALADRLEEKLAHGEFTEDDRAFIESLPYFFLATADAQGRPDVSFKGGMPGFVRLTGPDELAFPDYDGNGMFKSLGNIRANPNVGLLFIAMHGEPRRLRLNGTATVSRDDPLLGALHPAPRTGRAVRICAARGRRPARAGVEELRIVRGRGSSAAADFRRLSARLADRRLDDLAGAGRRLALGQRVDVLHSALDLAPHGILPVEDARVVEADEELAVGAMRRLGARHRTGPADMRRLVELGHQIGLVAATHAGARRIAALRHEAGDHAVEHHPIIEPFLRQLGDPRDMAGREIGPQLDDHVAAVEGQGQFVVGHCEFSCCVGQI
jgi:hypothetical protein